MSYALDFERLTSCKMMLSTHWSDGFFHENYCPESVACQVWLYSVAKNKQPPDRAVCFFISLHFYPFNQGCTCINLSILVPQTGQAAVGLPISM